MLSVSMLRTTVPVALLTEGMDRNGYQEAWADYRMSRPPHGGRG